VGFRQKGLKEKKKGKAMWNQKRVGGVLITVGFKDNWCIYGYVWKDKTGKEQ